MPELKSESESRLDEVCLDESIVVKITDELKTMNPHTTKEEWDFIERNEGELEEREQGIIMITFYSQQEFGYNVSVFDYEENYVLE